LANSTTQNQLLSSGKAIQTPEELYLLVKIYLGTGHAREAVELLQSNNFGPKSRFAEQDPQLISALLLEAFEAAEAWREAFTHCQHRLTQQHHTQLGTQDDGKVWILLVKAVKALGDPK
jgi:N-terminal acetyltransferase B complex non-catalytic subunit